MHAIYTENGNKEKKGNLKIYNRICIFNHFNSGQVQYTGYNQLDSYQSLKNQYSIFCLGWAVVN